MKLEHVGLVVGDLDAAAEWYRKWFGASEVRRFERRDFGLRAAVLLLGDARLELIQPSRPAADAPPGPWPLDFFRPSGAHHLAIGVPDVGASHAAMRDAGVELLTEVIEERLFFCRDPFGTVIEVRRAG